MEIRGTAEWDDWAAEYAGLVDPMLRLHDDELLRGRALRGLRVLDLGCGTGRLSARLAAAGARVCAVDSSEGMLALARAVLAPHPEARALRADFEHEDLPEGPFDLAFAVMVLHHVEDAAGFAGRLRRVLAPGGEFVAVDPLSARGLADMAALLFAVLRAGTFGAFVRGNLSALDPGSRLARHRAHEPEPTLDAHRARWAAALPGSRCAPRFGRFVYLRWVNA